MIVAKFGGTSVSVPAGIESICRLVRSHPGTPPVIVVSALAGVTDLLIKAFEAPAEAETILAEVRKRHLDFARELWGEVPETVTLYLDKTFESARQASASRTPGGRDAFLAHGEMLSSLIVSEALKRSGIEAEQVIATSLIVTDDRFGNAEFLPEPTEEKARAVLLPLLKKGTVPVVTGFIGATRSGETTTLGRGGSDYTAAILGSSLDAEEIQIWKEVDGIMTTDPRIVPEAITVPELAFEEACELSYFGAKVLHPKTILPAIGKGIPVRVANTFKPEGAGTLIVSNFADRKLKSRTIEAFSFKKGSTVIHIQSPAFFEGEGLMARIFALFEKSQTSIDMVATSVVGVTLTIDDEKNLEPITAGLKELGEVSIERGKAVVCAVGGSVNAAGVAGTMFTALGDAGIAVELISQAAGGVSITFVVEEKDVERAIKVLHKTYIEK